MASTSISGTTTGSVIEDANQSASGSVLTIGLPPPQSKFSPQADTPGEFGEFSISDSGQWTYRLDNYSQAVQELTQNQIVTDTFLIDYDAMLFASITVTIVGKNDPASITGDLALRLDTDLETVVNGKIKAKDIDLGESVFISQDRVNGKYGSFSISTDGDVRYDLYLGPNGKPAAAMDQGTFEQFQVATADGTTSSVKVTLLVSSSTGGGTQVNGTAGNDTLQGGPEDDVIDGGAGVDTVVFRGPRASYTVSKHAGSFLISDIAGSDGSDTLHSIEKVQFADKVFDLQNAPLGHAPDYGKENGFLFDGVYYLLAHPEKVPSINLSTVLQEWLSVGAAQHEKPNAWFDAAYYSSKWADLTPLNLDDGTLFKHYNLYGVWEGRSAGPKFEHFDGNRYLAENPDVAAYVDANLAGFLGSRTNGAIAHFIIYGANEQRVAHDTGGELIDMGYIV